MGLNERWVSDSWLFSLLISVLEPLGESVSAVAMLLVTYLCLCGIWWLFVNQARSLFIGTALTVLISAPLFWDGVVRAEHVGIGLTAILIGLTYSFIEAGFSAVWPKRILLFLLAIALVNTSGLFLVVLPFCAALILNSSMHAHKKRGFVLALFAALFCSPYGGFQVGSLLFQGYHFIMTNYSGLFAPNVYFFPFAFLLVILCLVATLWHEVPGVLSRVEILTFIFVLTGALSSAFFVPLATFFAGLVASQLWGRGAATSAANISEALYRLEEVCRKLPRLGVLWVALCLVIVNLYQLVKAPVDTSSLPVRAVDFILDQKLEGAIAHEPILGSYLVYRFADGKGVPSRVVAADDRGMSLSDDFVVVYRAFREGGRFWEQFLREYDPALVLCRSIDPVYFLLRKDAAWEAVFGDLSESEKRGLSAGGSWVVFQRRSL